MFKGFNFEHVVYLDRVNFGYAATPSYCFGYCCSLCGQIINTWVQHHQIVLWGVLYGANVHEKLVYLRNLKQKISFKSQWRIGIVWILILSQWTCCRRKSHSGLGTAVRLWRKMKFLLVWSLENHWTKKNQSGLEEK